MRRYVEINDQLVGSSRYQVTINSYVVRRNKALKASIWLRCVITQSNWNLKSRTLARCRSEVPKNYRYCLIRARVQGREHEDHGATCTSRWYADSVPTARIPLFVGTQAVCSAQLCSAIAQATRPPHRSSATFRRSDLPGVYSRCSLLRSSSSSEEQPISIISRSISSRRRVSARSTPV